MMKNHVILLQLFFVSVIMGLTACIEDGFSSAPSDQPVFSTDTLDMGVIFTEDPSPTSRFTVRNPHSKSLSISDVYISGDNAGCFRINVDGVSGTRFSDVEIRPKDSVYVLVETTLPSNSSREPVEVRANLNFTTNGVTKDVVLRARGQNVTRLRAVTLDSDVSLTADLPYQVYDSLVVAPGVTLTLEAGSRLCFHDKARMIVRGRLVSDGISGNPVVLSGDRSGNLVGDISFDIMSRQWDGLYFTSTSTGNVLRNTDVRNTVAGVVADGTDGEGDKVQLTLVNCRFHNSGSSVLASLHGSVEAYGCEFAEGGGGLVYLQGGSHVFNHCTFANNYLFAAPANAAIELAHLSSDARKGYDDESGRPYTEASFTNSIVYGLGGDVFPGDLSGSAVSFRRCLFRSEGKDDDNFSDCLWKLDPLYYTVREDYFFDYRLQPGSPAIGAADPELMMPLSSVDAYGNERGPTPDLGAYVFVGNDNN